ncbi:MAG: hypothetical protein P8Z00_22090 [Anaerolineales bacterium]
MAFLAAFLILAYRPSVGAQGADLLRGIFGDEAVARLEMILFYAQDKAQQIQFDLGMIKPAAPWQSTGGPQEGIPLVAPTPMVPGTATESSSVATQYSPPIMGKKVFRLPVASLNATPDPSPTPTVWLPAPATPLGSLAGEGSWTPYIYDASGSVFTTRSKAPICRNSRCCHRFEPHAPALRAGLQ